MLNQSSTYHFGLTGYPLGHSLSPKIHAAALKSCGLDGDYSLFSIHPDNLQSLQELLTRLRCGELHGLNVTIPHKQNVIPYLDDLTASARAIGAVNTIYLKNSKLIGHNTDAPGFLADLLYCLGNHQSKIENRKSAIVLGAGGSARAVIHALVDAGWAVTIAARRTNQARELAKKYPDAGVEVTDFDHLPLTFDLLVNTTPIGMFPNVENSPWPADKPFPSNAFVYDLIYNPRETLLVQRARAAGLPASSGLGMLVEQAALAFETWTGQNVPRDVLFQSVEN
jgi:shikimate dehydrogenase